MPTTEKIAETDEGQADLKGNELLITDKTSGDPCAVRFRSANGGIGKLSIDVPDGQGGWLEIGYLFGKKDERFPTQPVAEFEFWHRFGAQDIKSVSIRHDGVIVHVPLVGGGAGGSPSAFTSDDGRYLYNVQGDPTPEFPYGRIVQYRRDTMQPVAILRPEPL